MFEKILIANRGEIAVRIIRTAQRMGIRTVAVYSDADASSLYVAMADEAVHIGPSPVSESYLDGDKIIKAALATGAQAIHPGYGFLSENPDFAEAVAAAGLVFIGPSVGAIRAMGLKDAAKRLMEKAGVPVVPGYHGEDQGLVLLAGKAREIGYPILIKARAGGGGKGMRRVDHADDFAKALAAAKREAKAAFGDDSVLIEKYIDKPRHIEVQIFGDDFGNAVHLFERDCSLQRRHQKVIEEAPAPSMTPQLRKAMTEAAVKAAKAINYSGAGTIEFIVDASEGLKPDRFWFMEMNTRLQVEHPVTEMVTGIDLVEWQLLAASGSRLPKRQEEISLDGHAFEARLYAEDPARGFLPVTGLLHHISFPSSLHNGATVRIETGVQSGDRISPYYDPMIAKLVVHAKNREDALHALDDALKQTRIAGSITNISFLSALAHDIDFASGNVDTSLIERKQATLSATEPPGPRAMALAALAVSSPAVTDSSNPWAALSGYAHFHNAPRLVRLGYGEHEILASIAALRDGRFSVAVGDGEPLTVETSAMNRDAVVWPGHVTVFDNGRAFTLAACDPLQKTNEAAGGDNLRAPMPGLVKIAHVAAGDKVVKGQALLVLEAMKMEHTITAPHDGVIAEIVAEGAQLAEGTILVHFSKS